MRPELIQILSAGVAGIGFAMIFHIRPKHLPASFFGASLGWFLYLLTKQVWNSNAIGMMFAALGVTVYSEIGARILRMPVSVIYTPSIIPLIPRICPSIRLSRLTRSLYSLSDRAFVRS